MGITSLLYDADDPSILLETLTGDFARNWHHELNATGNGGLKIPTSHPDAALIAQHQVVRFAIDGTVRFGIVVGPRTRKTVTVGEESQKILDVQGLGLLALLGRGVVEPENGPNRLSPDTRLFNVASGDFDDSAWDTAVDVAAHDLPTGWPADSAALWLWGQDEEAGPPPQPVGSNWFRPLEFTLASEGDYVLFVAADDGYRSYLDAAEVGSKTEQFAWKEVQPITLFLDAGAHRLVLEGINIDRPSSPSTNIAGVIFSLWSTTNGGELAAEVFYSDETSLALPYPSVAPTMTPGEILDIAFSENQARGGLTAIGWDFTHSLDSSGEAWATPVDIGVPVGTTLLDLIALLVDLAIDIRIDPATLTVQAFNKGTMGTPKAIALVEGTHLTDLEHDIDPSVTTDALVKDAHGRWSWKSSGVGGARLEAHVQLGTAASDDQANRGIQAIFDEDAVEVVKATWGCVPVAGTVPYDDWEPGDTMEVPGIDDVGTPTLVQALSVSEPAPASDGAHGGTPVYAAEGDQEPPA